MKGIIRKTGEEITIISYGGGIDRSDVFDYVSYIDSHGVEHPREKLNFYWDIEVVNEQLAIAKQQAETAATVAWRAEDANDKAMTKREAVAANIFTAIIQGIYSKTGSGWWTPEEVAEITEKYTSSFMERFIKEDTE
jgi:hypothetical protein